MNSITDCYTLQNGVKIPCVGFGTWQTPDGDVAVKSVLCAIEAGYRHIDTAQGYDNEESVGEALKTCGVPREELFITSKLRNDFHSYDDTMREFEVSLKKLGTDYLDLFLIHWPNPMKYRDHWQKANAETWRAFEELYKAGKIRAIGLSNFWPHHIDELMKTAEIAPMVDQIKLCPGETQEAVTAYCRHKGIVIEAYSPMGTGKIFNVPEMQQLSEKYGKSIAQICIRWSLQNGWLPLPKSVTPERIRENTDVFGFTLDDEDVQLIRSLRGCVGYSRNPDETPF